MVMIVYDDNCAAAGITASVCTAVILMVISTCIIHAVLPTGLHSVTVCAEA